MTRLERQRLDVLLDLIERPQTARCRMDGCLVCPPLARRIRDVLTTAQIADALDDREMAIVVLEDATGQLPLVVFPSAYEATAGLWEVGRLVVCSGVVGEHDGELQLIVRSARAWAPGLDLAA